VDDRRELELLLALRDQKVALLVERLLLVLASGRDGVGARARDDQIGVLLDLVDVIADSMALDLDLYKLVSRGQVVVPGEATGIAWREFQRLHWLLVGLEAAAFLQRR